MSNDRRQIDRQREHQANERTFLAWIRTSLALVGFGFAIARFGLFLRQLEATVGATSSIIREPNLINSQTLGFALIIAGVALVVLSVWRYNKAFRQIEEGNYRTSRLMVWITAAIVIIFGILSIPFVFFQQPNPPPQRNSQDQID